MSKNGKRVQVSESVFAQALEAASRAILMNTAARKEAGAEGVALARAVLDVNRKGKRFEARKAAEREQRREYLAKVEESVALSRAAWEKEYGGQAAE